MKKILIAYATTEGQTRKIAKQVASWIQEMGHEPNLVDVSDLPLDFEIRKYDAFVVAGSIHVGKHQKSLASFTKRYIDSLNSRPTALLSVSASASRRDAKSVANVRKCTDDFSRETKLLPARVITVGGAILYTKYNFFIKFVMKRISASEGGPTDTSRDHELTNWDELQSEVKSFVAAAFPASQPSPVIS